MYNPKKIQFTEDTPSPTSFLVELFNAADDSAAGGTNYDASTFEVDGNTYTHDISNMAPDQNGHVQPNVDVYFKVTAFKGADSSSPVRGDVFQFQQAIDNPTDIHELN